MRRTPLISALAICLLLVAGSSRAQLPATNALLAELGFSADDIASVEGGKITENSLKPSNEREIVAGFAFRVATTPLELLKDVRDKLMYEVDPNTIAVQTIAGAGSEADFASLTLQPDASSRAKRYGEAEGGEDLNLSTAEIAAFSALGKSASVEAVEQQVRASLLARLQQYRSSGLAGIAPYDRGDGKSRDVAADLRSATEAAKALEKYAPSFYRTALDYPNSKAPGTREVFRWTQFRAHGTPTIALVHVMAVPDGDAFIVLQRQFYVSEGYNCEQAVAAFLPVQNGTVVVYGNRTSTDQVTGFGGSAKRSIGSSILASQLEDLFKKVSAKAAE